MKQRAEIEKEAIKAWKIETFQMISGFSSTLQRYKTSTGRKREESVSFQKGFFLFMVL